MLFCIFRLPAFLSLSLSVPCIFFSAPHCLVLVLNEFDYDCKCIWCFCANRNANRESHANIEIAKTAQFFLLFIKMCILIRLG